MLTKTFYSWEIKFPKILLLFFICCVSIHSNAQEDSSQVFKKKSGFTLNPIAVSANISTAGAGLMLHYQISKRFGIKIGGTIGSINLSYITIFAGNETQVKANFSLKMFDLFFDAYPWKNKNFRITSGFSLNDNLYNVNIKTAKGQSFGFINYTPDQIGYLNVSITGLKCAPYLGVGFDKTVPLHKIGIALDLGAFYIGPPKFNMNATGSFAPSNNIENKQIFEKAFIKYQLFPFVNFQLKYRIN